MVDDFGFEFPWHGRRAILGRELPVLDDQKYIRARYEPPPTDNYENRMTFPPSWSRAMIEREVSDLDARESELDADEQARLKELRRLKGRLADILGGPKRSGQSDERA